MKDDFQEYTWSFLTEEEEEQIRAELEREKAQKDGSHKISSDGGPASYYDFPDTWQTLNDYIEHKSDSQWGADSFHLANITKAACRWGDKEGTTKAYDARKIVYSALRILRRIGGPEAVQAYLKGLLVDKQFQPRDNL